MMASHHIAKRILRKVQYVASQFLKEHPKIRECNICGWQGRRFESDSWHPYSVCPRCRSEVRHRLLAAALSHDSALSYKKILRSKAVLHFAPEAVIGELLRKYAGKYVTADFLREDVDLRLDMIDMPSVGADSFDLVVACDVLEHVTDDHKALHEILRALRASGYAILTVPQKDDLEVTFEDETVLDPADRERIFGQRDHLRIYGRSFPRILESVGFEVTVISEASFSEKMVRRHVLFPPIMSRHPLATNYRKVFFAQKS
jgi:SAM-dependent methyltransferase